MIDNWKELGCDDQKLTWAHRSDGSGTTKAFTNSMEAFSPTSVSYTHLTLPTTPYV